MFFEYLEIIKKLFLNFNLQLFLRLLAWSWGRYKITVDILSYLMISNFTINSIGSIILF